MKVWIRTFGCRANQYDSEAVRAMVLAAGGEMAASPRDADVAVFNSCAVTADAEADLRQAVRRAARERPDLRSVVMGCAAALPRDPGDVLAPRALPTVVDVVPGADLAGVAAALGLPPSSAAVATSAQTGSRALLRVQDGCDEHCTFCATTLARGASRSRPIDALVREAEALADTHAEIVVTGVHIGSYGADVGSSLGALVERLVAEVPRVRFRLTSIEATEVDDRLRAMLRDGGDRVCPYLHAPLQSGSDRILRRMGRHWYTAERYVEAVERLVDGHPAFGLGADVVAGFPGETEADHAATLAVIERLPFTELHVFPYSARPGTAATRLGDTVDPETRARRAAELRAVGATKQRAHRDRRVGTVADIVVVRDGSAPTGLTEDHLAVTLAEPAPRRSRFVARLAARGDALMAFRGEARGPAVDDTITADDDR